MTARAIIATIRRRAEFYTESENFYLGGDPLANGEYQVAGGFGVFPHRRVQGYVSVCTCGDWNAALRGPVWLELWAGYRWAFEVTRRSVRVATPLIEIGVGR